MSGNIVEDFLAEMSRADPADEPEVELPEFTLPDLHLYRALAVTGGVSADGQQLVREWLTLDFHLEKLKHGIARLMRERPHDFAFHDRCRHEFGECCKSNLEKQETLLAESGPTLREALYPN